MTDQTPSNIIPFDGFKPIDGNFTQVPNQVFELMPTLSGSELKCLLYIVRHTLGFQDKVKTITIDEFEHGRKKKDGQRMDDGVGMGRETIVNALKSLAERAIITRDLDARDKARQKITYGLHQSDNPTSNNQSDNPTAKVGKSDRKNRKIRPRSEKHTSGNTPKKAKDAAIAAQAGGEPPLAVVPAEKPRDLIFDALALGSFGIAIGTKVSSETASRVGLLKKWLKNNYGGATDATVGAFYRWYDTHENGASRPRDVKKFASAFDKFHAEVDARKNGGDHSAKMADLMNLHAHDLALSEKKGA